MPCFSSLLHFSLAHLGPSAFLLVALRAPVTAHPTDSAYDFTVASIPVYSTTIYQPMKSCLWAPHSSHDLASLVFILFLDGTKAFPPSSHCPLRSGLAPSHAVGLRLNIITSKRLSPMAPSKIAAKSGLQSSPQPQTINTTGYPEDSWPHTHSVDPKIKPDPPGLLRKLVHTNWGVHLLVCPVTIHSPLFWAYAFYFMWGAKIPHS